MAAWTRLAVRAISRGAWANKDGHSVSIMSFATGISIRAGGGGW